MDKSQQGALGESLARTFLESVGYEFVGANFHRRVGEIDLIMRTPIEPDNMAPRTIVFVEVRFRATRSFGGAIASIDWKKQRKMIRVARAWLQKYASSQDPARIDVIAIEPCGTTHLDAHNWNGHQLTWIRNAVEENAT